MDQHLIDLSQLRQIKILYNLTDEQLGKPPEYVSSQMKRLEDYPQYELVAPKLVGRLDDSICKVLVNSLATQFYVTPKVTRKFLLEAVEQWGKLCRLEGGDIMHAHDIVSKCMDSRDASFIHHHQNLPEDLGQLQYIVVIPIPKSKELKTKEPQIICLAVIRQVHTILPNARRVLPIPHYSQNGALDPADIKSIQCVASHVEDRGKWGLVDRSGPLAHACRALFGTVLTFSSATASMVRSTDEFCVALNSADVSRLGHAAARLVLLMGEVVVIGFAARVLERTRVTLTGDRDPVCGR
ncbi:hypothetical protein V8E52_007787 [Russula decolorans]